MADPNAALAEIFGFDGFRPGQQQAVEGALAGRDVLLVMPTGAGKSLCYQLPALLRDDLSIVVSPLVSLMMDQVESLQRRVGDKVGLINAQQDAATNRQVLQRAQAGQLRLLYVAPERFASPGFLESLKKIPIGCFIVDEAHCVSQWGHDFRPDYFRLAAAARWLNASSIFASTATATPQVAKDIQHRLGLNDPVNIATGFDRPNLTFAVVLSDSNIRTRAQLSSALSESASRPAIVYAGTRKQTEEVATNLSDDLGIEVLAYHAGIEPREKRAEIQRRFMDGSAEVVVATNAFGMGVDKADVRTVIHVSVPQSIEGWYQEAGRAGRDGLPSRALLLAKNRDKGLHVFFIKKSEIEPDELDRIAAVLLNSAVDGRYNIEIGQFSNNADQLRAMIGHLTQAGVISPSPAPIDRQIGRVNGPYDASARSFCQNAAKQAVRARWDAYKSVWGFVERSSCRRVAILAHFDDHDRDRPQLTVPCCDVCAPESIADVKMIARSNSKAKGASSDQRKPTPKNTKRVQSGRKQSAAPQLRERQPSARPLSYNAALDDEIIALVAIAKPAVGRTRAVEVLRGGRSKALLASHYDQLECFGTFSFLPADQVLGRIDTLLDNGVLRSTGGRFPKLASAKNSKNN